MTIEECNTVEEAEELVAEEGADMIAYLTDEEKQELLDD